MLQMRRELIGPRIERGIGEMLVSEDDGNLLPVQSSEFGAGWAAVKFEISF